MNQVAVIALVRALHNYPAPDASSLSFTAGQTIEVLTKMESGWWDGLIDGERGWFPSNYVEEIPMPTAMISTPTVPSDVAAETSSKSITEARVNKERDKIRRSKHKERETAAATSIRRSAESLSAAAAAPSAAGRSAASTSMASSSSQAAYNGNIRSSHSLTYDSLSLPLQFLLGDIISTAIEAQDSWKSSKVDRFQEDGSPAITNFERAAKIMQLRNEVIKKSRELLQALGKFSIDPSSHALDPLHRRFVYALEKVDLASLFAHSYLINLSDKRDSASSASTKPASQLSRLAADAYSVNRALEKFTNSARAERLPLRALKGSFSVDRIAARRKAPRSTPGTQSTILSGSVSRIDGRILAIRDVISKLSQVISVFIQKSKTAPVLNPPSAISILSPSKSIITRLGALFSLAEKLEPSHQDILEPAITHLRNLSASLLLKTQRALSYGDVQPLETSCHSIHAGLTEFSRIVQTFPMLPGEDILAVAASTDPFSASSMSQLDSFENSLLQPAGAFDEDAEMGFFDGFDDIGQNNTAHARDSATSSDDQDLDLDSDASHLSDNTRRVHPNSRANRNNFPASPDDDDDLYMDDTYRAKDGNETYNKHNDFDDEDDFFDDLPQSSPAHSYGQSQLAQQSPFNNRKSQTVSYADASPARMTSKIKAFFGDAPPPSSVTQSVSSKSIKDNLSMSGSNQNNSVSWFLRPSEEDSIVLENGQVKGGTLRALVARLTTHEHADLQFRQTFMLTMRTLGNLMDILQMLIKRYNIQPLEDLSENELAIWKAEMQRGVQLRVIAIFKTWFSEGPSQCTDMRVIIAAEKFLASSALDPYFLQARPILQSIIRLKNSKLVPRIRPTRDLTNAPPALIPKNPRTLTFLTIDVIEMSRQLTLLESSLFSAIRLEEFECKNWSRNDPNVNSDNIKAMIQTANNIANWVALALLRAESHPQRSKIYKHFVLIAEKCRDQFNYSTTAALISGLTSPPITRLKHSCPIAPKTQATMKSLETLMSRAMNFKDYRDALRSAASEPACVPFLGQYLTDLTFLDDANPDHLDSPNGPILNFMKRQKFADIAAELQAFQQKSYALQHVQIIRDWIKQQLDEAAAVPADELYKLSLEVEPREVRQVLPSAHSPVPSPLPHQSPSIPQHASNTPQMSQHAFDKQDHTALRLAESGF